MLLGSPVHTPQASLIHDTDTVPEVSRNASHAIRTVSATPKLLALESILVRKDSLHHVYTIVPFTSPEMRSINVPM